MCTLIGAVVCVQRNFGEDQSERLGDVRTSNSGPGSIVIRAAVLLLRPDPVTGAQLASGDNRSQKWSAKVAEDSVNASKIAAEQSRVRCEMALKRLRPFNDLINSKR